MKLLKALTWSAALVVVFAGQPAWAHSVSAIQGAVGQIKQASARILEFNAKLDELTQKLRELEDERRRALRELAEGAYCSQCSRPKSQIERETGASFQAHLTEVQGRPIPASQAVIDAKAKEYDDKIRALRDEIGRLASERDGEIAKKYQLLGTTLPRHVLDWRQAQNTEGDRLERDMLDGRETHQSTRERLIREYRSANGTERKTILMDIDYIDRQFEAIGNKFRQELNAYRSRQSQDLLKISDALSSVDAQFLVPWGVGMSTLAFTNFYGPLEFELSWNRLKVGVGLGKVSSQLEIENDWFKSTQQTKVGLESWGFTAGMGMTTKWGENGIETLTAPTLDSPDRPKVTPQNFDPPYRK